VLAAPRQPDHIVAVARAINCLPNIQWAQQPNGDLSLQPASVEFWAEPEVGYDPLPPHERTIFLQIIASFEIKKGFLLHLDLMHGDGSVVPVVRFHETYDSEDTETLYYMQSKVSAFD
jgi:hypothetical protein